MSNQFEDKETEKYFNEFQSENIDDETLRKGEKKAGKLGSLARDFLLLIQMVKDHFSGDFNIDAKSLAIIIGTIVYVVSPIDAVPDVIPVLGYTDDAAILGITLKQLLELISRYKNYRNK